MMNPTILLLMIGLLETAYKEHGMFEHWNRFVTETQRRLKGKKPRGHPQTEKELQNRRKARQ